MDQREDYYDSPIKINDAANILLRRIGKNERPYVATNLKLNNELVEEWKNKVLKNIADSRGAVPSGRVWGSWELFIEGKNSRKFVQLINDGYILPFPEEVVGYWRKLFETASIEELHSFGAGSISYGWNLLTTHTKMWFAREKYEKIFSKSDDPLDWERSHHKHKELLHGEVHPFGWTKEVFSEIQDKVKSILMNQVYPQQPANFR